MVEAQYRLLREKLGVEHVRLVLGTSMGGMQTWLWGEEHPEFMDALMPLASLPVQIAGRNRVMRKMILDGIRGDPAWKGGDYEAQPRQGLVAALDVLLLMGSAPLPWQVQAPSRQRLPSEVDPSSHYPCQALLIPLKREAGGLGGVRTQQLCAPKDYNRTARHNSSPKFSK